MSKALINTVKDRIARETPFAIAVFRKIYENQKPDEKRLRQHIGHDGRGFQEIETPHLCRLYERLTKRNWKLSAEEADMLRSVMQKYARQYLEANRAETERKRVELADECPAPRKRPSRFQKIGSGPSPERGADDDLRGVFDGMDLGQRVAAIDRMAERMGV